MPRLVFLLPLVLASPTFAATGFCQQIAKQVETSLRAFKPPPASEPAWSGLSIRNAIAHRHAAALDFGRPAKDDDLRALPLTDRERDDLANSVVSVARAPGLVLIDAEAGTAHCHTPHLFVEASGGQRAVAIPSPEDPFERCGSAALAVGSGAGRSFYVETEGDAEETERLKVFTAQGQALAPTCSLEARYHMEFASAEAFCVKPDLCRLGQKASTWARAWKTGGAELRDPAFEPVAKPRDLAGDPATLPAFGRTSQLAPEPFAFGAEENFFAIHGEPEADLLRVGAAREGPANMADWKSLTLVALYNANKPVASYVIARRRAALQSVAATSP